MKNEKGCVLSGCLIMVVIAIIFYAGLVSVIKALSKEPIITEDYVVTAGQTLWDIALENKKEGTDTREYVYQLRQLNNINDCIITPGQKIKIIK